jgi:hypothetical protein
MKKIIIAIGVLIVLCVAWYLGAPLFIDKKVSEESPVAATATSSNQIVASGMFTGFDQVHNGSGTANLIKTEEGYVIRFESDFQVNNGPDLYVGFGKNGVYIKGSEVAALKGNIGSQNYVLPAGFDANAYNEVWIWCKQFGVPFAKAILQE